MMIYMLDKTGAHTENVMNLLTDWFKQYKVYFGA